ncbi:P44/Msp2 family outer membrane protein, partial [Anaplasma phagocytophilum]
GSKEDEADTVYLLAKELAYDVVNSQTDKLTTALAGYKGKDIAEFAKAVGITSPEIDKKVCNKAHSGIIAETSAVTATAFAAGHDGSGNTKTSQCSGLKKEDESKLFSKFVEDVKIGEKNWPEGQAWHTNGTVKSGGTNSNAKAVATDLTKLTTEEKTKVAGLLAKTIEGGEVVEIRAVSSTSVMVNACYDLLSEGLGVVPYACVGLGGHFMGVVEEYSTHNPSVLDPVCP